MNPAEDFSNRIEEAIKHPKNLGELDGADAVGTVGSEDCGDMLRMWVKFKEVDGKRVIDRATFQTFGCGTAIAVASVATELISGKTVEEALTMSGEDLSAPLGSLPPLKDSLCTTGRGSAPVGLSAGRTGAQREECRSDVAAADASAGAGKKENSFRTFK